MHGRWELQATRRPADSVGDRLSYTPGSLYIGNELASLQQFADGASIRVRRR